MHSFSCSWYNFFLLFSISLPLNCEVVIGAVTRAFWQISHHLTEPKKEVTHFSWVKGLKNSCPCLNGKFVVWYYMQTNINGQYMFNQYLSNKYEQKVFLIIPFFYAAELHEGFVFILPGKVKYIRLIVFTVLHVMCISICYGPLILVLNYGIKLMQINLPSSACFLI